MRTRLAAPEGGPSQPSADRRAGKNVNPTIRLPLIRSAAAQTTPVPEVAVDTAAVSASVLTDAPAPTPVVTSAVGTDRAVPLATAAIAPAVQSVPARRPAIAVLDNVLAGLGANPATNLVITLPTMAALTGSRQTATAAAVVEATAVAAAPPDPTALLPGDSNGVTGVQVGHSKLEIPCGPNGYTARADWYFPTQVDGTVQAQGVIWLQHGFGATKDFYGQLATELAQQTNSIVVAPTLSSLPSLFCPGCYISGAPMQQAAATLFLNGETALNTSAAAAGYQGTLPTTFILAGHSAGGGFATGVAADTVQNGAAGNLLGVVMFDGVSVGTFDGTFSQQLAELDGVPVYQIAAPGQIWNNFAQTTNILLADRPGQFDGVVMAGGSHVDSMLGKNPLVNLVLQLVTKRSPAGNTAANYRLSTGWINDMYVGATPLAPQYGFYPAANEQLIMGEAAALGLPSPVLNQLSPLGRLTKNVVDFVTGIFGIPPTPEVNTGSNGLTGLVTPPLSNGVTGVKTGHAVVTIPTANGYDAPADWYFPTQADGSVQANGVVWLQHGFFCFKGWYQDLAVRIAQETNSIVVAPQIFWFNDAAYSGEAAAQLFVGDRSALNISANKAGYQGLLPESFILTGNSAGGSFATVAGGYTVDNGAAADLLGVVMFDGVSFPDVFEPALAKLDSLGIPDYQIAATPQSWNAYGVTTEELAALHPGQFVGTMIDNGSHADSLGGNWFADLAAAILVKPSPPGGKAAVGTFATGWINDLYAGNSPTNPYYGIYGNPNDGTYVANQPIVMGEAGATTLPAPPPVDVKDYAGLWYELGSVKLPFEWFLVNTTATYTVNPDNTVGVTNSGNYFGPNGPKVDINGTAVAVNSPTNTRLNVGFFFGTPRSSEPGNYWILDYAPDYSWAIVSDPSLFSGYILSRTQTLPADEYQALVDRARQLGVWGPISETKQYI
ncbi:MAG: lipocalin family protein [Mycobacterium sp.]|nr:lipocalin family protein [Mycobacterium sp.]